jgi:ubiquinone/menaquinone biosynthesis C-methylase UbiE
MKRLLEPEVMENIDEVIEYDRMKIGTEIDLIDECLAISVLNMGIPSGDILDLGTGTATVPIKIFQYSSEFKITGIDLSSNMLSIAEENIRKNNLQNQIQLVRADVKKLPFEDNTFDLAYSNLMLHHIPNPVDMIQELQRVVKTEGAYIIRDLVRPHSKYLVDFFVKKFGNKFSPYQKQLYKNSLFAALTKNELNIYAVEAGLTEFSIKKYLVSHIGIEKESLQRIPSKNPFKEKLKTKRKYGFSEKLIIANYIS